jgi:hypothetical protein
MGNGGTWNTPPENRGPTCSLQNFQALLSQANGVIFYYSSVLRALRKAEIHIVALHNHMVGEQPAYYFTHFWGKGPALELARGLRSVLDAQKAVRPEGH